MKKSWKIPSFPFSLTVGPCTILSQWVFLGHTALKARFQQDLGELIRIFGSLTNDHFMFCSFLHFRSYLLSKWRNVMFSNAKFCGYSLPGLSENPKEDSSNAPSRAVNLFCAKLWQNAALLSKKLLSNARLKAGLYFVALRQQQPSIRMVLSWLRGRLHPYYLILNSNL